MDNRMFLRKISFDSPIDNDLKIPLLDVCNIEERSLEEIVLSKDTHDNLENFLEEHRREDILYSYNRKPSYKVLLNGDIGCGKTMVAEAIAYELNLPLAIVRLDSLISSSLRKTVINFHKIVDFIKNKEIVILFDEFDVIAKERFSFNDIGEIDHTVSVFSQMLSFYHGKSIILAETNYNTIIDKKILKCFDYKIEFSKPSEKQILKILGLKLRGVRRQFELEDEKLLDLFSDYSGADIEQIVRRAINKMILDNKESLTIQDLEHSIKWRIQNN